MRPKPWTLYLWANSEDFPGGVSRKPSIMVIEYLKHFT